MRVSIEHWNNLMNDLMLEENKTAYNFIIKKYSEKHRAYHNLQHIEDCLLQLDEQDLKEEDRKVLELAFWYHDVIYDPYSKENELKSAEAARDFLVGKINETNLVDRVYDLIMITRHNEEPANASEAMIMDIDISILGRSEAEYLAYTKAIRREYKMIPYFYYKRKRKEILKGFLKRERLYFTQPFYEQLEEQARRNIEKEIIVL